MLQDDAGRKEVATAAGLLIFAVAFVGAVSWNGVDDGRRTVDRGLREVVATVEDARACNISEAAIARFVKSRLENLREQHPHLSTPELVGDLLHRARFDVAPARREPGECARVASRLAPG